MQTKSRQGDEHMPRYGYLVHNEEYDITRQTSIIVNQPSTNINQASQ